MQCVQLHVSVETAVIVLLLQSIKQTTSQKDGYKKMKKNYDFFEKKHSSNLLFHFLDSLATMMYNALSFGGSL